MDITVKEDCIGVDWSAVSEALKNFLAKIENCHVILYASPGKEGFYQNKGLEK